MSSNPARPKRAAEDYARTHHEIDFGPNSKKPRFDIRNPSALAPDALEEDATLEADVIGNRGQQVRRGAVNIDGYDSDSENENFNARADAKARQKEKKSKEEEDNDMFADLEEEFKDGDDSEGEANRRGGKKKAVRFLNEDEIEGQVHSSKSGGHVPALFVTNGKGKEIDQDTPDAESSTDSEVDDETRASTGDLDTELGAGGKKFHAPKLDAFNMSAEQEEGRFDDQGNYVRKAVDPDAIHDVWLEGLSKKDMRRAKEAADKRDNERRQRDLEDDSKSNGDILQILIPLLQQGETILEALARLGKGNNRKPKWENKNKNRKHVQDESETSKNLEDDPQEVQRRESVEAITGAADLLLTRGQVEIYDTEREMLIRQFRRETGEDWLDKAQTDDMLDTDTGIHQQFWEYKWTDGRDDGVINGPYDVQTMQQWNDAGYFGEGVEFRLKDSGDSWTRVPNFSS